MPQPLRIIVHAVEGAFMLDRDFTTFPDAIDFARKVGFNNYEITTHYNKDDWVPLDNTLDPVKVMSFMKQKDAQCQ